MSVKRNIGMFMGLIFSVSLLTASLTAIFLTEYLGRAQFRALGDICGEIIENQQSAEQAVMLALKEYRNGSANSAPENILSAYGYRHTDFQHSAGRYGAALTVACVFVGGLLFLWTSALWHKKSVLRIQGLTEYLEKVNTGNGGILPAAGEDDFSKLQDEIYKTVTELYQTRESALRARENFAENLYNIAHQIKTPITSISLSTQMMQEAPCAKHLEQIRHQLSRLIHLEEALLLLSRIDAGTLALERKETDVFTVLMLAADNLQELFDRAQVSVQILETGEATIFADREWTMEALMNLLKNCLEHTPPGGSVSCSYEQNPLYTQIRIWDTGVGFAMEDIPRLFERFFRGKNAGKGGNGIGLAIAKAIIESQNGTVSASNLPEGGACFEVRIYSH